MRYLICFGTRPEAIKMAPVCKEMQNRGLDFRICVTGQHREMLDQVLNFFKLEPDYDLDLMEKGQSLNSLGAKILKGMDGVLLNYHPDMVLVHGDTTTSIFVALAAFHRSIKIAHIEAGLRTYNRLAPFPEEVNRQITARLADLHFAPTTRAKNNLIKESIPDKSISITGNTVIDALLLGESILEHTESFYQSLKDKLNFKKKIILVTGHRRENFGKAFEEICDALLDLANLNFQVVFPVHLNPGVRDLVLRKLRHKNIVLLDPLAYPGFIFLMRNCDLIISDSGGIQEEAPTFGKTVLVTREVSERSEGVDAGYSFIVGHDRHKIVSKALNILNNVSLEKKTLINPYGQGNASFIIVDKILEYYND